jgi:hypothetical protein
MYRSNQFLAKVEATSTGYVIDNLPRDSAVTTDHFIHIAYSAKFDYKEEQNKVCSIKYPYQLKSFHLLKERIIGKGRQMTFL